MFWIDFRFWFLYFFVPFLNAHDQLTKKRFIFFFCFSNFFEIWNFECIYWFKMWTIKLIVYFKIKSKCMENFIRHIQNVFLFFCLLLLSTHQTKSYLIILEILFVIFCKSSEIVFVYYFLLSTLFFLLVLFKMKSIWKRMIELSGVKMIRKEINNISSNEKSFEIIKQTKKQ